MRAVFRMALLLGGVLTLTGCFNRLDISAIEREIEAEIESQSRRLSLMRVACPANVARQAGAYFRCVGYVRPEGEFTINVVQSDSEGTVAWDVPNSQIILNMTKVETRLQEEFAKAFAKRVALNCGEMYRLNQPGEQFQCEVVGGTTVEQAQVTSLLVKVDPDGNLNWYEVREAIAPVATAPGATPPSSTAANPAATGGSTPQGPAGTATPASNGGGVGSRKIKPPTYAP